MELSVLQQEFLDDHRVLIAGINSLIEALEQEDADRTVELAVQLDRDAGAHMAFEEEVFYPRLAKVYGAEFVERMVSEHEAGHRAVKALLGKENGRRLTEDERSRVLEDLEVALQHVMSCGTMLSELTSDSPETDAQALARLRELRQQAARWTQRAYGDD